MNALLLMSALIVNQPQAPPVQVSNAPPVFIPNAPPLQEKSPSHFPSYWEPIYFPAVVFVGTKPREIGGFTTCVEPIGFAGEVRPSVMIFHKRGAGGMRFDADIDDASIRAAHKAMMGQPAREVSPQATPFASPPQAPEVAARDAAVTAEVSAPWLPVREQERIRRLLPLSVTGRPLFYNIPRRYQAMHTEDNGRSRYNIPTPPDGDWPSDLILSGGLQNVHGWKSYKALDIPDGKKVLVWKEDTDVRAFSLVPMWKWQFPVGTRAYDVLVNDNDEVFEARTQVLGEDNDWQTKVYRGEGAPPAGYNKDAMPACASCHNRAGMRIGSRSIYLHAIWGYHGRFSWRPFDESGELDARWPVQYVSSSPQQRQVENVPMSDGNYGPPVMVPNSGRGMQSFGPRSFGVRRR